MSELTREEASTISLLLDALANETRLLVLGALEKRMSPQQIFENLRIPRSTLQFHLKTLVERGFISGGRQNYRLTPLGHTAIRWISNMIQPFSKDYSALLRVISDLQAFKSLPKSTVGRLTLGTGNQQLKGIMILKELDRTYARLMLRIKDVFLEEIK